MNSTSTRFASALIAAVALFNVAAHAATFTESSPAAFAAANSAKDVPVHHCLSMFYPAAPTTVDASPYPVGHVFVGTEGKCLDSIAPAPTREHPATFRAEGSNVDVVLHPAFYFTPDPQGDGVTGYPVTFRATGSDVVQVIMPAFHFRPNQQGDGVTGYPITFRATGSDVVQIITPAFHPAAGSI